MAVSREVVQRLAEMTRIGLDRDEIESLTGEMAAILEHVNRLQAVDTSSIAVVDHVTNLRDVTRPDSVSASLPVEDVLTNAPERHGDFFVVPAVLAD